MFKNMTDVALMGVVAVLVLGQASGAVADDGKKGIKPPPGHPLSKIISGFEYRTKETQTLQQDEIQNPGMLWVERGSQLWSTVDGVAGKSCASCHNDAASTMKSVAASYPKWDPKLGKPVNVEQRINICRTNEMKAEPWKFNTEPLTAMTTFVKTQGKSQPVSVKIDGPMASWFEKGKALFYQRTGQLDMSCASCHEKHFGQYLRSDYVSQGQINGFPTYRLAAQNMVPVHQRFYGCMFDIRAEPYAPLSDEFLALELYIAYRGTGLAVETPAVRN